MTRSDSPTPPRPDWHTAPAGWDWAAQDADGRWYWYRTEPLPGIGGGVWRSNSRNQQFAVAGAPNPDWLDTKCHRPSPDTGPAAASD